MRELVFSGHNGQHPLLVTDEDGLRSLRFGTEERQSCLDLEQPWELQLDYTRWMMTALLLHPAPRRLLLFGLGGGAMAHFLLHHHPEARLTVVEMDPHIIRLAQLWFALPGTDNLHLVNREAAAFLAEAGETTWDIDIAFLDIFGPGAMAAPLFDQAFHRAILDHLSPDGLLAVNLWSGDRELFDRAREAVRQASDDQLLEMQVKRRSNAILLAFPGPIPRAVVKQAHKQATAHQRRYGLDFPQYLKRLRRANRLSLLFRLFH
jgi:spermidine synthase